MVSQIFKSYIDKHKLKHKLSKMLQDINYTTRVAQKKKKNYTTREDAHPYSYIDRSSLSKPLKELRPNSAKPHSPAPPDHCL